MRKLHSYVGLYFLLSVWLFAGSGLLLNHPGWTFAQFWEQRQESNQQRTIAPPGAKDDVSAAMAIATQLGLRGELERTERRAADNVLRFRISQPGSQVEVDADLDTGMASLHFLRFNGWGVVRALHAFTGTPSSDPTATRDWIATKVWSFSMDALAGGLVFIVLSGIYVWLQRGRALRSGALAFALGIAACGFFVFALKFF